MSKSKQPIKIFSPAWVRVEKGRLTRIIQNPNPFKAANYLLQWWTPDSEDWKEPAVVEMTGWIKEKLGRIDPQQRDEIRLAIISMGLLYPFYVKGEAVSQTTQILAAFGLEPLATPICPKHAEPTGGMPCLQCEEGWMVAVHQQALNNAKAG
jgi:hypothetical protein